MNIEKKVHKILHDMSSKEHFDNKDKLQDLGLDSLDMVTLLLEVEDTFGIVLDESDMNPYDLQTVEDIIHLVEKYDDVK